MILANILRLHLILALTALSFIPEFSFSQEPEQEPQPELTQEPNQEQIPAKEIEQTPISETKVLRKRRKSTTRVKKTKQTSAPPPPALTLPPPPRTPSSVAPVSYTVFRFSQYSGDVNAGQMFMQTALNTPGSTYLLGTIALNSGSTNSTRPTNLQSFSSSLIFDGPHWQNIGLSATFNSAGAETDTGRAGLYYRLIGKIGQFGYLVVPHLLFNKTTQEVGRVLVVYNLSVYGDFLVISGSTSYTWDHEAEPMRYTVTFDPALEFKIYSTIRAVISHTHAQSNGTERNATGFGLEFRQVF